MFKHFLFNPKKVSSSTAYKNPKAVERRDIFKFITSSFMITNIAAPAASASPKLDGYKPEEAKVSPQSGRSFFPTITPPFQNRATYRYTLRRDAYALEQLLTFGNVTATIRTIVQVQTNGKLWVHGPLYPTGEYRALLDELGEVEHVVLPCNALEHKAPMEAFLKVYKPKSVWITPGQYSVFGSCGMDLNSCQMPYQVDGVIPMSSQDSNSPLPPWSDEFEFRTLYLDLPKNAGPVSETAFVHKPTRTLITTDSVIYVPETAPPIFDSYFQNISITSNPDFWPKTVLQSVFLPLREEKESLNTWPGYKVIQNKLVRAPILRSFVDARAPKDIQSWVEEVASMGTNNGISLKENKKDVEGFDRILTAHFASPIQASPSEFKQAFAYLFSYEDTSSETMSNPLPKIACEDWELLQILNDFIDGYNLGAPTVFDYKRGCVQ